MWRNTMQAWWNRKRDSKCELTWHDPLADQLLSSASLLKFELEDCMDPEMKRREKRGEEESQSQPANGGNRRDGALSEVSNPSVKFTRINVVEPSWGGPALSASQFILPVPPSFSLFFFLKSNRRRVQSGCRQTTMHFLFLGVFFFFFLHQEFSDVWKKKKNSSCIIEMKSNYNLKDQRK